MNNARAAALDILLGVLHDGRSADAGLAQVSMLLADPRDVSFCRALVYGVLREHRRLAALRDQLLRSPLKTRDQDMAIAIELGLLQLMALEVKPHAAVSETVALARSRGKAWAAKLINAVLRRFQREQQALLAIVDADPGVRWSAPDWLVAQLKQDWPQEWQALLAAQNTRAAMTLRVNQRLTHVADYQAELATVGLEAKPLPGFADALVLAEPAPVDALPGFRQGQCSVQDGAAQLAAGLLAPRAGARVLDACAAPGGKSAHLLESSDIELLALDSDAGRLEKVAETLTRLQLTARMQVADAGNPEDWWDGRQFDAILLDAPCSGSGVIRRHPDIKWLRRADDPPKLEAEQKRLLTALWPLLAAGGRLLYATCSVLQRENEGMIKQFMAEHDDAHALALTLPVGREVGYGFQILTGEAGVDGFYYACLEKTV